MVSTQKAFAALALLLRNTAMLLTSLFPVSRLSANTDTSGALTKLCTTRKFSDGTLDNIPAFNLLMIS